MNEIDQIRELLDRVESPVPPKANIGVAITTHNRNDLFEKSYNEIKRLSPKGTKIVVVDDCSSMPVEVADYTFSQNAGIARAKNKCLELLYLAGCEHMFLFDDDTYPLVGDWWKPYVESREPHLNYIFKDYANGRPAGDMVEVYRDTEIVAYSHVRGCMMYFHRSAIERVGGMDTVFGKWGYEHPSLSDRIYMAGLTSFRYMDVVGSKGLFHNDDEHTQNSNSTVKGQDRLRQVETNLSLYEARRRTSTYMPFIEKRNILLTCYFSGVSDPQRGGQWTPDIAQLQPLIRSLKSSKLVVLHDCLDVEDTASVTYIRVATSINPYFQRWVSYRQYLMANRNRIANVFCVDATDVVLLNEPEWHGLGDFIYTGDENTELDDAGGWMRKSHKHPLIVGLLDRIGKHTPMLNAGLLGGSVDNLITFMGHMTDFYCDAENDARLKGLPNAGMTDMGAFNYVARTYFGDRIRHGGQVNTRFKSEETNNYSWFKHK